MLFSLFYIICSKLIVGQESYVEMLKNNYLKQKLNKRKIEIIKYKNGLQIFKKIYKQQRPN